MQAHPNYRSFMLVVFFRLESFFVDFILENVALKCPNAVNTDGIKIFLTVSADKPSTEVFLFRMLQINDDLLGYPNVACQNETNCSWLLTSTAGEADFLLD